LAHRPPEIVSTLFGFHCLPKILDVVPVPNHEAVAGF
jgi:hypothetical protein